MYRANLQRTGVYNTQGIDKLRGIKWKLKIDSKEITAFLDKSVID